jgi:hypothetical protein
MYFLGKNAGWLNERLPKGPKYQKNGLFLSYFLDKMGTN